MIRRSVGLVLSAWLGWCSSCSSGDVSGFDAQGVDAAPRPDSGSPADAGTSDLGLAADATTEDARAPDAGPSDATPAADADLDAGPRDADLDAGPRDAAGPLLLQNATATFSQTNPPAFPIGDAFDGVSDRVSGWAIHPNEGYQAAVVETSSDTPVFANGTRVTFRLDQIFQTEHALGRFRLAYTTRPRSEFADGNEGQLTPGDVGAPSVWIVPKVQTATTSNGAQLTVLPDHSILAQDLDSADAVYTVTATLPGGAITGFRIEVLNDPSLPNNGPGLQDQNGNFVLSEMSVIVEPN